MWVRLRDPRRMGAIYKFLGLTCQAVTADAPHQETRRAFESVDVVYLTARTLGFSYLQHISALRPQDEASSACLAIGHRGFFSDALNCGLSE